MNRSEILSALKNKAEVSVLIVGGGINGAGAFRDLALNDVDVLLVENGEFRLVREAVQERNRLLQNAPHYVKPLPTTIPIFKHFSGLLNAPLKFLGLLDKPSERGSLVIKIGLMLYDAYSRAQGGKGTQSAQRVVPKHQF